MENNKKKKATITVDRDDFEEIIREKFNREAAYYQIPRGKLLSRGMYLACRELRGDIGMDKDLNMMRIKAGKKDIEFPEDVVLNSEKWKQLYLDI